MRNIIEIYRNMPKEVEQNLIEAEDGRFVTPKEYAEEILSDLLKIY